MANPIFIPLAFAANGIKNLIQKVRQVGQDAEDFTWNDGAPLITMTKIEDGGKAPKGPDFNGVLNALSEHVIYGQNGGRYTWSQDVVDEFSGYSLGAIVQSDDTTREFRSLAANNTVNPNNGLGGVWEVYSGQGSIPIASSTTAGITKVINTLNSNDVGSALSAAQGMLLSQTINQAIINLTNALNLKLNSNQALGVGQTWQDMTSSRVIGATYTNNTERPIQVNVSWEQVNQNESALFVGSVAVARGRQNLTGGGNTMSAIVPSGSTYRVTGGNSIVYWAELR